MAADDLCLSHRARIDRRSTRCAAAPHDVWKGIHDARAALGVRGSGSSQGWGLGTPAAHGGSRGRQMLSEGTHALHLCDQMILIIAIVV